jgi:hypothetical protein
MIETSKKMEQSEYEEKISRIEQLWEALRLELASLISDRPPNIVYHYTDINGLLGMIESGKIWATHVSKLNDSSEYHHGTKVVTECVNRAIPDSSTPFIDKILSEFEQKATYVASYSTEHDLLSQWRSYSGGKVGYCLGLATEGIASLDDSTPLLEAVIYHDNLAQEVISKMLCRVDEYFQKNQFGEFEIDFLLGSVGATLVSLACTIKHSKFEEENEFRQFYQPNVTSLQLENNFRNGNFGLTPYVEIPFIEHKRLPLRSVTIGPCQDADLEKRTVSMLLEKDSYRNVQVLVSEIPLRV